MEEEKIKNYQTNFKEEIEDLYRLHYITKKYDHIIPNPSLDSLFLMTVIRK